MQSDVALRKRIGRTVSAGLLSILTGWAAAILLTGAETYRVFGACVFPVESDLAQTGLALGFTLLAAIVLTLPLVLGATILLRLTKRESWIAYAAIGALVPIALAAAAPAWADEPAFIGSIAGACSLTVWWLASHTGRPPEKARADKRLAIGVAVVLLALTLALLGNSYRIVAREAALSRSPSQSVIGDRIVGGVATAKSLLLYNAGGKLVSYDRGDWSATVLASRVIDVKKSDGAIWTLSVSKLREKYEPEPEVLLPGTFQIRLYQNGRWHSPPPGDYDEGDRPVGLLVRDNGPTVIGRKAVYLLDDGQRDWRRVEFSAELALPATTSISVASPIDGGDVVYLGFNLGEWGGGLVALNLRNGAIQRIERRDSDEICAGPLNTDCDPVTGVVPDLENPACVLASVGLSHFLEHGRIIRICGDRVEVVLERPLEAMGQMLGRSVRNLGRREAEEPFASEAFFGLAADGAGGVWTVSRHGVYRLVDGDADHWDMPAFDERNGLMISTRVPNIILVTTDRNAVHSVSGFTPMMIAAR